MELRRSTIFLFGLRLLRALLSLVVLSVSAYYFGLSVERDIWVLAFNCILVLDLAIWGPVNETFRAKFIFVKEQEGEEIAVRKASSLLLFSSFVTVLITTIILLYPDAIAKFIAPVYYESNKEQLILMIRLLAPSFLVNQVSQLGSGILNAYKSFYLPEISGLISTSLTILVLLFLVPTFGIYSLVISYYLGLIVLFFLLYYELIRKRIIQRPAQFFNPSFKDAFPFLLFALPFFLPYFAGQVNLIAEKSIANILGQGKVSIVDYCRKFIDIPINALSSVLTMVLLPTLSSLFSRGELRSFSIELQKMIQTGLLVLSLVMGFLLLNADSIVSIFYGFRKIDENYLLVMAGMIKAYSVCAFSLFFYSVFGIAMIAYGKGRIYAFIGILAQVIMIGMNVFLNRQLDVLIFPYSLFIAHFIASIFLVIYFPGQRMPLLKVIARYSIILALIIILPFIITRSYSYNVNPIFSLVINSGWLLTSFIAIAFIMNIEEKNMLVGLFKRRILK
jgi:putative peptidoglycan lipid II flippase